MDERSVGWVTIAILVVVVLALTTLAVPGGIWLLDDRSAPDSGQSTFIDSCTTISEPGAYALTEDITDSNERTCIRIESSDVVLTGNGHQVQGTGAFGTAGIVAESDTDQPLTNVTVRDVAVTDWDDGIRYIGVDGGAISETTTTDNRVGISLLETDDVRVHDNTARENRLRGISLLEDATNNTVANNTATGNARYGIHLVEPGVRNNTLASNVVSENGFGITLVDVRENMVTDNDAERNELAGIWLSASRSNEIRDNAVSNQFYGVFLADRSNDNSITGTTATANEVGIRLRSSDGNQVRANTLRSNTDTAILLISSDDNAITDNAGAANARGVVVLRSTGNTVANNTVS